MKHLFTLLSILYYGEVSLYYNPNLRFNVWDTVRQQGYLKEKKLASVTALKVDSSELNMITGDSIGYIQVSKT